MAEGVSASLPYHEPGIATILLQSSFLLLLNVVNFVLDKTLYCGLLGQVFLGIAFGSPGAKWFEVEVEEVIVQLGYLGLLLLVFEGGLATSFKSLKANLLLSLAIAATGIAAPMGLSFVLTGLVGATSLQAFAAGAALCSTSLGTTFTVLTTSGLLNSRLGVALTSAAMMDDVVGLVMVQIISNLGPSNSTISVGTIMRPIFVSVAFAVATPLTCWLLVKPLTIALNRKRESNPSSRIHRMFSSVEMAFVIHALILLGFIAASTYAGSSNLLASYIAGASISWWDAEVPHVEHKVPIKKGEGATDNPTNVSGSKSESNADDQAHLQAIEVPKSHSSGLDIFRTYYHQPLEKVFKPMFFASIGFSIPISLMFSGPIVWRGIIYTVLMAFSKLLCGIWLVRIPYAQYVPSRLPLRIKKLTFMGAPYFWCTLARKTDIPSSSAKGKKNARAKESAPTPSTMTNRNSSAIATSTPDSARVSASDHLSSDPRKPLSLYPASILGGAMVARGEIGFLISSIAESNGIFSASSDSDSGASSIFLIVTWAIVLCTILGPLCVGLLVRRVKKLQKGMEKEGRMLRTDVLGVWGVE